MSNQTLPSTMSNSALFFVEPDSPLWHEAWNGLRLSHMLRWGNDDVVSYNALFGESWQYMGSVARPGQPVEHQFRHRMHPISGQREYIATQGATGDTPTTDR
jgi:hypothetical protein